MKTANTNKSKATVENYEELTGLQITSRITAGELPFGRTGSAGTWFKLFRLIFIKNLEELIIILIINKHEDLADVLPQ